VGEREEESVRSAKEVGVKVEGERKEGRTVALNIDDSSEKS
jgi:hypothetical protein